MPIWGVTPGAKVSSSQLEALKTLLRRAQIQLGGRRVRAFRFNGLDHLNVDVINGEVVEWVERFPANEPSVLGLTSSGSSDIPNFLNVLFAQILDECERLGLKLECPSTATIGERWAYLLTEFLRWEAPHRLPMFHWSNGQIIEVGQFSVPDVVAASIVMLEILHPTPVNDSGSVEECSHSDDFTAVWWFGELHRFAKGHQAQTVKLLWEHYERRPGFGLGEETIGTKIEAERDRFRLAHVFREHPSWKRLIHPVGKGIYALMPPEKTHDQSRITKCAPLGA